MLSTPTASLAWSNVDQLNSLIFQQYITSTSNADYKYAWSGQCRIHARANGPAVGMWFAAAVAVSGSQTMLAYLLLNRYCFDSNPQLRYQSLHLGNYCGNGNDGTETISDPTASAADTQRAYPWVHGCTPRNTESPGAESTACRGRS